MSFWSSDSVSQYVRRLTGRPGRWHIVAVVCVWLLYLLYVVPEFAETNEYVSGTKSGNEHGPPLARAVSHSISTHLTLWQAVVITNLVFYMCRNFDKLANLDTPDLVTDVLYIPSWSRAVWIHSALKAGHWTAMPIRRKWLRDIAGLVFTGYYLLAWEQGEEKVRRINAASLTIRHMRVAWEVGRNPYIAFLITCLRPKKYRHARAPRMFHISRSHLDKSFHSEGSVETWLYFNGDDDELAMCDTLILDIPGGGFVSMSPRESDDRLMAWNQTTGLPVLSINYNKAPEYPYPFALHECFDIYRELMATGGRGLGMNLEKSEEEQRKLKIIVTGDSSGGNLATSVTLMVLERQGRRQKYRPHRNDLTFSFFLEPPISLILAYPALDLNGVTWVLESDMHIIQDRTSSKAKNPISERQHATYDRLASRNSAKRSSSNSPRPSDTPESFESNDEQEDQRSGTRGEKGIEGRRRHGLALSSLISYFGDRVLSAQLLRACTIMYIGKKSMPDLMNDYLLSPIRAPESLLAKFPKVYLLTGERDPLIDSTVIFAGRVRRAKETAHLKNQEHSHAGYPEHTFNARRHVEARLIPGISHGFLQLVPVYPDGWALIEKVSDWMIREAKRAGARGLHQQHHHHHHYHHLHRLATRSNVGHHGLHKSSDDDDDDEDIELEESRKANKSITRSPSPSSSPASRTTYVKSPSRGGRASLSEKMAYHEKSDRSRDDNFAQVSRRGSDAGSSVFTEDTSSSDTDATIKGIPSDADLLEGRMESLRGSLMR